MLSPGYRLYRAAFPVGRTPIHIVDVHMSNELEQVRARAAAALVVNGAFFAKNGDPIGLAISDGKRLSAFSSSMSGGVLWIRDFAAHLSATEEYMPGAADFAIQCRPRLVVKSRVNIHGDTSPRARRTAICLREGGKVIEFVVAFDELGLGPTLFELAMQLAKEGCEEALNLDGGPSTGWASVNDAGVSFLRPLGPVRHAIAIGKITS